MLTAYKNENEEKEARKNIFKETSYQIWMPV